ncbi:MAG TPA: OPT/YSL family transporter, partial [Chthoniobacterales bacterium]|nr:OPT/YSL family transporter [Chthoniobacterales bacterium]
QWSLWWGVTMMVVGSLIALAGKPEIFTSVFKNLRGKRKEQSGTDVLKHIELPLWLSYVGVPLFSVIGCWFTTVFFGVPFWLAVISLPLIVVLTIICVNSMALTSWTPTGSLSKITQFTIGAIDRTNPASNLMTAGMTAEVASNAGNLLSDIKPGYMLGAKPRQQAAGHVIGIFAGALAATPLFFVLFLKPDAAGVRSTATLGSDLFPMPSAMQWKGVAELIARGIASLPPSAVWSMLIAALFAAFIEIMTIIRRRPFPLSSVSIGLGVILPPEYCFTMWFGALFFWWQGRRQAVGTPGHRRWVEGLEPICAGLITGAALVGVADALIDALLF